MQDCAKHTVVARIFDYYDCNLILFIPYVTYQPSSYERDEAVTPRQATSRTPRSQIIMRRPLFCTAALPHLPADQPEEIV